MAQSPELQSKIAEWRAKSVAGTMTIEEYKEAIKHLRGDRKSAAQASETARRTKARKVVKSVDEMLDELGGV